MQSASIGNRPRATGGSKFAGKRQRPDRMVNLVDAALSDYPENKDLQAMQTWLAIQEEK